MFDAVFAAAASDMLEGRTDSVKQIDAPKLDQLKSDPEFLEATQKATATTSNVMKRLKRAQAVLQG